MPDKKETPKLAGRGARTTRNTPIIPHPTSRDNIKRQLQAVFRYAPEDHYFLIWRDKGKRSAWFRIDAIGEAAAVVAGISGQANVWLSTYVLSAETLATWQANEDDPQYKRGTESEVAGIVGFHEDFDLHLPGVKDNEHLPATIEALLSFIAELPIPPSLLVASGHGVNAWWLFREPWMFGSQEERNAAKSLLRRWQGTVNAYAARYGWEFDATADLCRILRVAGTYNLKDPAHPTAVTILADDGPRAEPSDFAPYLLDEPELAGGPGRNGHSSAPPLGDIAKGARNKTLARIAGSLRRPGLDEEEIAAALLTINARRCVPPLSDDEVRGIAHSVARYAPTPPSANEPGLTPPPDEGAMAWPEPEDRGTATLSDLGTVEYIEDIIRSGRVTVWGAEEASGKSYATSGEMAMRIAVAGGSFAGTWPVHQQGPVLVLSEMHSDDDFLRKDTVLASLGHNRADLRGDTSGSPSWRPGNRSS